jgi:arsenate reductase-like glutaredoxin family protein
VAETVAAKKVPIGPAEALRLLAGIDRIVAARGRKVVVLDLKADRPDDTTILSHLIGRTGNLRAPTARVGRTLLVGFNPDAYRRVLRA